MCRRIFLMLHTPIPIPNSCLTNDSVHRLGFQRRTISVVSFMPPTRKSGGHIGFGLSVCMYVCMYSCSRYRLETSCMYSSWQKKPTHIFGFP